MVSAFEPRLEVQERRGPADVDVVALTADSRAVVPGGLFAAIPGTLVDGHRFVDQALDAGVNAVVLRDWPARWPAGVVGLRVADPRRALAQIASAFYGDPAASMRTFGITGTNGKTSTVAILASILRAAGLRTGTLGTVGIGWDRPGGFTRIDATHTTPDGPALFELLGRMRDDGVGACALELSSHALEQGRAAGLALDVAAWSNLSRDHLDFHGTLAAYEAAKARLFTEWLARWGKPGCAAVVNVDDPVVQTHAQDHPNTIEVSARPGGAHVSPVLEPLYGIDGIRCIVRFGELEVPLRSTLLGAHNLANCLLAGACAWAAGLDGASIAAGWATTQGAPGRLERVEGEGPRVLVDYAHTPDAITQVLGALRPLVPGQLVVVFGCGGDRDAGKRPLMARAAAAGADAVIATSDNPRHEDPEAILDAIVAGFAGSATPWRRIADRAEAIAAAVAEASPGDVILIAGKGHEDYQIVGDDKLPFDDRAVARQALEAR